MKHYSSLLRYAAMALLIGTSARAQEDDPGMEWETETNPMRVALGLKGGAIMTTPRGVFPSLIVGDSKNGSGVIPAINAESAVGSRFDATVLIPFSPGIGLSLAGGTMRYIVQYSGDSAHARTRLDVQTTQVGGGLQFSLIPDQRNFDRGGLRAIYVDAGVDLSLGMLANRVESTSYRDSLGESPSPASGSFANSDPFRTMVAVRGAVGMRFAPEAHLEIIAETSYSYGLNPVFSGDVITDNDFTIDNLGFQVGIGYRF